MAQKTTLSATATPGQAQTFTAKEAGATGVPPTLEPVTIDAWLDRVELDALTAPIDLEPLEALTVDAWLDRVEVLYPVDPVEP